MKLFNFYLFLSIALAAFVVNADLNDQTLESATTPAPSFNSENVKYAIDEIDNNTATTIPVAPPSIDAKKKKQQDIAKADAKHGKRSKPTGKGIEAKHMVCNVVAGSLVCYSINQNDIVFEDGECTTSPDIGDKKYTICSKTLA